MSKAILWVGFVLAIVLVLFGFFIAENAKPLMFVFWFVILIGSGYKLFFAQAQNK
jgi:flagellar motor component MotA